MRMREKERKRMPPAQEEGNPITAVKELTHDRVTREAGGQGDRYKKTLIRVKVETAF